MYTSGRALLPLTVHVAKLLSATFGSRLPMAYSGDLVLPEGFDLEQELLDVAARQMTALGERLGVEQENRRVEIGNTGHTILRIAEELGVDLILVGSHGRHGLAALLGSTARSVLNGARCDVLAVRVPEG